MGALLFYYSVCNNHSNCIIAFDRGFWLFMSHIIKDTAKNNTGLVIVE